MTSTLLFPMLAMVLLTFGVLAALFITRTRAVLNREVPNTQYLTYVGDEPDGPRKLSRNFVNLFEAPVLFYVVCLAAMHLNVTGSLITGLAWTYVALRVLHTIIHTGANILVLRIAAYFSSWAVLLAMWVILAVSQV